jgi:hypothetical protein
MRGEKKEETNIGFLSGVAATFNQNFESGIVAILRCETQSSATLKIE